MFQLSVKFLFLLNNRATRPRRPHSCGVQGAGPSGRGMCCPVCHRLCPAWLTRAHELQASELAGSRLLWAAEELDGAGSAHARARAPGCPAAGSSPHPVAAAFYPQSPLVSPEPEKEALDGAISWRRKQLSEDGAGHAQGCTAGKSQSWGSNGLFRAPGRTFPLMAASLLSPACGLSADLPVPSGGTWGTEGNIPGALTAEQSPPIPASSTCVSRPASRTEPAQSHRCTRPTEATRPAWLPPSRYQPGDRSSWWPWGPGNRAGVPGVGSPCRDAQQQGHWHHLVTGDADLGAGSRLPQALPLAGGKR